MCIRYSCKGYIILDGVKKVEFNHIAFISCHIQPFEGGGFKLAPRANCSDGKLSVCVVSHAAKMCIRDRYYKGTMPFRWIWLIVLNIY